MRRSGPCCAGVGSIGLRRDQPSTLPGVKTLADYRHLATGKVRELYEVDDELLLMVASDRISAYDHILPNPIPDKGHAISAKRLSRKQRKAGNLTKDEFDRINRKADKVLEAEKGD